MVLNYNIENFLSSWADDDMKPRVDFTILGEPGVQNGWKIRWKGLRFPRIYDPRSRDKASLRIALREEMLEEIFPPNTPLKVTVSYYQSGGVREKDLDNMSKFLFDALEGALYPDDRCIKEMHAFVYESHLPRTIVSVETI